MKKIDLPSKIKVLSFIKVLSLLVVLGIMVFGGYVYYTRYTYNSIKVDVVESASIEYGSANYSINDLIKKVDGDVISVKNDIDTSKVGEQEVVLTVKKNNVVREIPVVVSVVDTTPPVIKLKEEKVTITKGDDYDLTSNIDSVNDQVDGVLSYLNEVTAESNNYYDFTYDASAIDDVGTHEVIVNAKDKNGNLTFLSFNIEVVEPAPVTPSYGGVTYGSAPSNAYGNDVVSIAYSLIGSPYVGGAAGPYAFDCSGFVYYVYSRVGVGVSRSSYTQAYDGVGVSYENAEPGDILSWGHGGVVTHSALYVGGGMMIHATNPSQGVVLSSVAGWQSGSIDNLMAVRRVQ